MKIQKIIQILLWLVVALFAEQCAQGNADSLNENPPVKKEKSFPVKTLTLESKTFSDYLEITGTVRARNQINIMAEEGGVLERLVKDKGRFAGKGDTLAILENHILEAGYKEAKAVLNQAQTDFKSKKVLYNKNAISELEYLSSKYNLERSQALVELAEARYSKLFITAPMEGLINDRFYDLGAYVTPMTPLYNFIDNAYVKITAGVAERFLGDIQVGKSAIITFDAYPDLIIESKVTFVSRSIDPKNRTFQIEIGIPNPGRKLAPQMIANVQLLRRAYENQIVVPLDALIESETGWYVFLENDTRAKKVFVNHLAIYENQVLITGLKANQRLIVVGHRQLSDGNLVQVIGN